jgi:predicted transcriptional regulator
MKEEIMATMELMDEIQTEDDVYELTPEEERIIDEGLAEFDAGLVISGEEVKRKTREWLRNYEKSVG